MTTKNINFRRFRGFAMGGVLLMAVVLLVAQKKSQKEDSPARYGCRVWIAEENGQLEPIDPNAGDGPPERNEDIRDNHGHVFRDIFKEVSDDIPSIPQSAPIEAPTGVLFANRFEVFKIGNNSVIGREGDYVMEFFGGGFVASEGTPIVHIGDTITLEDSHVGADGKQLMVVMPADVADDLNRRSVREFAIQNPGGLDRNRARWARMPVVKASLLNKIQNAETKDYVQGAYFLERK